MRMHFAAPLLIVALLLAAVGPVNAQTTQDFFISTQTADARAKLGAGQQLNPGFNPCNGGSRNADGTCSDTGSESLLGQARIRDLFPKLPPGSITDNMFGLVLDALPTGETAGAGTITLTGCDSSMAILSTSASLPNLQLGLNCGEHRLDPRKQGQTIPVDPKDPTTGISLNSLTAAFTADVPFSGDFCAGGATDCDTDGTPGPPVVQSPAHIGFDLKNNFKWTPNGSGGGDICATITGGFAAAIKDQVCAGIQAGDPSASPPTPAQKMRQVTSLTTTASLVGNLTTPGQGEQTVDITIKSWSATSRTTVNGTTPAPVDDITCNCFTDKFTVEWASNITDPDFTGFGGAGFSQVLEGKFLHNGHATTFAQEGRSDYPTGQSQTLGQAAAFP